jgi:release factor glutamine methyltransferase
MNMLGRARFFGLHFEPMVKTASSLDQIAVPVDELVAEARRQLAATSFGASPREAALLAAHVFGMSEAQVLAYGERRVAAADAARFRALLARRAGGEPFAYLTGEREFYGRAFAVDQRVLIPRPETEHLIAAVLGLELPPRPRILDIGTGSGAIAVTLACELAGARVIASDLSPGALAVAAANARRHGVAARLRAVALDLTRGLDLARVDLVVSNPPYVDPPEDGQAPATSPEVYNFEPHLALFSAGGGESTLVRLFAECATLRPGVRLVVEIGYGQAARLTRRAAASGLEIEATHADYGGIPRILVLRRP